MSLTRHPTKPIHLILDSYIKNDTFTEEKRLRNNKSTSNIAIIGLNGSTHIPQELDKFWASEESKRNLQLLVGELICKPDNRDQRAIRASCLVSAASVTLGDC